MNLALSREDLTAGLLAAAVHAFFVVLLVVGVSWQIHDPQPVMADIWQSLPSVEPARTVRPAPPPAPEPESAPTPIQNPAPPQAKPASEPDTRAADIALEKKKREALEQLERKQALEAEKKLREEARQKEIAEAKRRAEIQRDEEELRKRTLEESIASESSQLQARAEAARRASEVDKLVARYQDMISAKIRGNTRLPDSLSGNPQVEFRLGVLPSGEIVKITLTRSSGNVAFDQAVQRGIEKSSPLPLPGDRAALEKFRDLTIKHRARE
jgi:colicin import membrane protein